MAKVKDLGELGIVLAHRDNVVMTTGAFDVPHDGHRRYLRRAKGYGEVLVLLLHSDELISLRKGPERPIRKEATRVRRLARGPAYKCIDYIYVVRTQNAVYDAIRTIQPNTLVTSDTTKDDPNSPNTMRQLFGQMMNVITLEAQSPTHSTDIIRRKGLVKNRTKPSKSTCAHPSSSSS